MSPLTVSLAEAAQALGITPRTARKLVAAGTFPVRTIRIGGQTKVHRAALLEFIDGQQVAS
jgi:excisionase family DNA binding protein